MWRDEDVVRLKKFKRKRLEKGGKAGRQDRQEVGMIERERERERVEYEKNKV